MDIMQMINAINNPMQYVMQQCLNQLIATHPNEWKQCNELFNGKSKEQQISTLKSLYDKKGIDLMSTAKQLGVTL